MTRGQRAKKSESVHRTQVHVGPEYTRQGAVGKAMEGHAAQGGQVTLWGSDFDSKTSHLDVWAVSLHPDVTAQELPGSWED